MPVGFRRRRSHTSLRVFPSESQGQAQVRAESAATGRIAQKQEENPTKASA